MNTRTLAGWIALGSGLVLVLGIAGSALASSIGLASTSSGTGWMMDPTMMGSGQMGQGVMGAGHMGQGVMGAGHMGPGMMDHGMMGFGTSGPASTAIPGAAEVRVQAANFSFSPGEVRLPKNADVNLSLTNPAGTGVVHDFTVPALGIHVAANPGETRTVGLRGLAPGRYDAYCSVPGHAELGMRATVIVE